MSRSPRETRFSRRRFLATTAAALSITAALPLLQGCQQAAPTPTPAPAAKPTEVPKPAETPKPTAAPAAAASPTAAAKPTAAAQPTAAAKPTEAAKPAAAADVSDFGAKYPDDAAPKDKQYTQTAQSGKGLGWKSMDFNEMVYARAPLSDLFSEPLVRISNDYENLSGTASKWEVSKDGKTWTFYIDKGLMWSDGNELTAEDYIATFRYTADPKHSWDFVWYWDGVIKNYTEVAKGKVPSSELGVRVGGDKYQFVVETVEPTPWLPKMMLYSWPLSKAGLDKYGSGAYNTNPATCISCGPYVLEEWSPDRRFVVKANPKYTGKLKPLVNRQIVNVVSGGSDMARYQAGEVDTITVSSPADVKLITDNPDLKSQMKTAAGDFATFYLFFDVNTKPWDNMKVRQAFAKAVDREAIAKSIMGPMAKPAYSYLMPGFPDSDPEKLKSLQMFDPAKAKALLAEAGYPNGQGFPKVTLMVRGGANAMEAAVVQAAVASINQTLGVQVDMQTKDKAAFYQDVSAKPTKVPFGWISYGMDYFDATNMLGVWLTGGRHSWSNKEFDKLVKEGGRITDDPEKRSAAMKQAEKILVEEAPAIFVYHALQVQLHKPYRKGTHLGKNKYGYDGVQFGAEGTNGLGLNTLYIGKEVLTLRK